MSSDYHSYYDRRGNPIDREQAMRLLEDAEARRVGRDEVGEATVSTVHLVLNHQFTDGPPLIFESMVFGGPHNDYQWRYATEEQARVGHARIVAWLRGEGEEPE